MPTAREGELFGLSPSRYSSIHAVTNQRPELVVRWEHVYDEASGQLRFLDPKTGKVQFGPLCARQVPQSLVYFS